MLKFLTSSLFKGSLSVQSDNISTAQNRTLLDIVSNRTYTEFLSTAPIVDFKLTITDNNAGNNSFYDLIRMNPTINHSVGLAGQSSLLSISPAITKTGASATVDVGAMQFLRIAPAFSGGHRHVSLNYNTRAIFIDPTFTEVTGSNNFVAFENTRGVVFLSSSSGSVGVGFSAAAPLAKLHVRGDSATTGSAFIVQNSTLANLFEIRNNGNVTINQGTDAGFKLDVNGTARVSSSITAGSFIRSGGTASQFLKADGSIDASLYITTAALTGYVPYTGATANVNLNSFTLLAKDLVINHSSGSGVAASITKGGSGEALTVVKSSGSGNAASITGGVTLISELHTTTAIADAYIASAANWNVAFTRSHRELTLGAANGLFFSGVFPGVEGQQLSLGLASGSANGALSSTDWNTFNNKQNALTNPITGTGTTNFLPKFTGATTLGNSLIFDNGTNVGIGTTSPTSRLHVVGNGLFSGTVTASSFIRSGGTAAQFLKADGSVDTNIYLTTPTVLQTAVDADKVSSSTLPVGTTTIKTLSTSVYSGAFFDYVVINGSNRRVGTVVAISDGTNVEYFETFSDDLGSTSNVSFIVDISGGTIRLRAVTTTTGFSVIVSTRAI